jgi:hypothetical protein
MAKNIGFLVAALAMALAEPMEPEDGTSWQEPYAKVTGSGTSGASVWSGAERMGPPIDAWSWDL